MIWRNNKPLEYRTLYLDSISQLEISILPLLKILGKLLEAALRGEALKILRRQPKT